MNVPVHLKLGIFMFESWLDVDRFGFKTFIEMPCDVVIVALQCQQSTAENIFFKA